MLDEGSSHGRGRYHLRIGDLARAIHEVLDERGRGVGIPARREDVRLERQRHGSCVTAAMSLIPRHQLLGDIEQLVPLAEVEQRPDRVRLPPEHPPDEATPLADLDAGSEDLVRGCRAVDVEDKRADLLRPPSRLVQVVQAAPITETAARAAARLEREHDLFVHLELAREGKGLLGEREALVVVPGQHVVTRELPVRPHELRPRRLALQHLDGLVQEVPRAPRLAAKLQRSRDAHHRLALPERVAPCA